MDLSGDFAAIKAKLTDFLGNVPPEVPVDLANEALSDLDTLAQKAGDAIATAAAPAIAPELIPEWNAYLDGKAQALRAEADAAIEKLTAAKL
jgi:hypothetical protein